ncbi:aspartate carbamoyltransferase regulatory subunit [Eubacterium multiforme]|uniref:Aspartate carbamoyltransferase regulatory subunit n=1 Tax=Eubacterium multiforme TaxID=83339 RepID=A0ABT9UQ37_9FIRM|nr:aspartate carbamoyltransferase regulatory subunit [Eubacterium multiforme]MDQ0148412.1 aspartate carbamoyltransferase regulatory subunit [Eubacterium multiforme]
MLEITSIKNGLVIDHIKAGVGIKIFKHLNLEKSDLSVALIMNVQSGRLGRKDIIKVEGIEDIDYSVLAMLSPNITINEVRDEKIVNKLTPELPQRVENVITCDNVRCITNDEKYVPQIFNLVDRKEATYRCEYCDHTMKLV